MTDLVEPILQHLTIVLISIVISAALGVALGIISYWVRPLGTVIIWISEIIQTIPSLALLAILMVIFGLGDVTLIIGLILYALLPIIRSTFTGLLAIPQHIKEAARGMGMSRLQRLQKIELPLSFAMIFSGIKIALVNSLSIAIMGVLIGAGGLGFIVYTGIQQNNITSILTGAVPVVLMALLFDFLMSKIEKRLSPNAPK